MTNDRAANDETVLRGTVLDTMTTRRTEAADLGARSHQREMALLEIKPRPHGDTRALDTAHVEALADSIAAVGLLHPITVDAGGHLIAGAHRLAAVRLLHGRGGWQGPVPVSVYPGDVASDPKMALDIEVSENDKRKDYTAGEIRELARRLKAAGYRAEAGRPRRGEKPIIPALMVIVGKSKRQVLRVLAGEGPGKLNARRYARRAPSTPGGGAFAPSRGADPDAGLGPGEAEELFARFDAQVLAIRDLAERVAVLPLDGWASVLPWVEAVAQSAREAAEALENVANVAISMMSMINGTEHDTGDEEVVDAHVRTA